VVASTGAPVARRTGADQHDGAGRDVDTLARQGRLEIADGDLVLRGEGSDLLEACDVDENAARNDWRDRRDIRLPHAEVAAPVGGLHAVVEVTVRSMSNMREPVDLRRHVVVHEDDVAVPRCAAGVATENDSGLNVQEVQRIASARADDGQIIQLTFFDRRPDVSGGAGLDRFRRRRDLHHLINVSNLKGRVHSRGLVDVDGVVLREKFLETLLLNCDRVVSDLNQIECVRSTVAGFGSQRDGGAFVRQRDRRARDGSTLGIRNNTGDARGRALREPNRRDY